MSDEISATEQQRRQRISAARRGRAQGGDGGAASLAARQAKAKAFADEMRPIIEDISKQHNSHVAIAGELNRLGLKAIRGGAWSAKQVERILLERSKN